MMRPLAILTLGALFLTGCMVGPKYSKPPVTAAPAFSEQPPQAFTESAGWKQAQPADTTLRADWWQLFGVAELTGLEEQIDPTNQTLKAAEARFRSTLHPARFQANTASTRCPST